MCQVIYWQYNDGWHEEYNPMSRTHTRIFDSTHIGWSCWAYHNDHHEFEKWMKENMTGPYSCTRRFNGGDGVTTLWMSSNEDATLFKLRWM